MRKERFTFLLIALMFMFILYPFLDGLRLSRYILDAFFVFIFLSSVFAVSYSRKHAYVATSLLALWIGTLIAVRLIGDLSVSRVLWISNFSAGILFYAFTAHIILSYVLKSGTVTRDRISASICAYLLIGMIWGLAYCLVETLNPGSFAFSHATEVAEAGDFVKRSDFMYYSIVTMTTLGYGDITPISSGARSFSALEALVGQLYVAILIARLVGLHIAHSMQRKS